MGWGRIPICGAGLSCCLVVGPLFWECPLAGALPHIDIQGIALSHNLHMDLKRLHVHSYNERVSTNAMQNNFITENQYKAQISVSSCFRSCTTENSVCLKHHRVSTIADSNLSSQPTQHHQVYTL